MPSRIVIENRIVNITYLSHGTRVVGAATSHWPYPRASLQLRQPAPLVIWRFTVGKLEGRVAVITGGASGIGEGTVRLFAGEGARVVIADIEDDRGEALASELGDTVVYQRANVSREDDIRDCIQRATDHFGRLD